MNKDGELLRSVIRYESWIDEHDTTVWQRKHYRKLVRIFSGLI